jgi:pimeloyl-ACP methyl ester carboxylesterase
VAPLWPITVPPDPTSRVVRVGDLRVHYLDFGGDGPPLLLLHATGFHAWLWLPYARRFATSHRVLALDQRGHGESDKPPTGYRWERFGEDVAGFLDALGLDAVRAVGHSKGGTAIAAAATAGTRRLARAVLIDPVLMSGPPAAEPATESPLAPARAGGGTCGRAATRCSAATRPHAVRDVEEEFVRLYVDHGVADRADGQVELRCPGEIESQVYAEAPMTDGFALLDALAVPTLVVRGERSPASASARRPTRSHACAGRVHTIPRAGHFVPMERSARSRTPSRVPRCARLTSRGGPTCCATSSTILRTGRDGKTARRRRSASACRARATRFSSSPDGRRPRARAGGGDAILRRLGVTPGMRVANTCPARRDPRLLLLGDVVEEPGRSTSRSASSTRRRGAPGVELVDRVQPDVLVLADAATFFAHAPVAERAWWRGIVWLCSPSPVPPATGFAGWQRSWLAVPEVTSFVAAECGSGRLHVDEAVVAEVVDGVLVLTPLGLDTPLVRYLTDVRARLSADPCACGDGGTVLQLSCT